MLEIEPDRQVEESTCYHCGGPRITVTGFVLRGGDAHAIYFASCFHHDGHEVWIDGVFSPTWDELADDRVTFGARIGTVEGRDEPAASLVPAAAGWADSATFGRKLTREEALEHPRLGEFWELVDHVLAHDAAVSEHIYGAGAKLDEAEAGER